MARPKSEDKRSALLDAAIRVIDRQGLGAPTSLIAREAGIANGSLFTYFKTKSALFNELYLELKTEMAAAALRGVGQGTDTEEQFFRAWSNWTGWAVRAPERRRVLTLLGSSEELTPISLKLGHQIMAPLAELLDRARQKGSMSELPLPFVAGLMNGLSQATMDSMVQDPSKAAEHCRHGFEALWRMLR